VEENEEDDDDEEDDDETEVTCTFCSTSIFSKFSVVDILFFLFVLVNACRKYAPWKYNDVFDYLAYIFVRVVGIVRDDGKI
jgi:hypothetical protein